MTCKDCIHYGRCKQLAEKGIMYLFSGLNGAEENECFEDKSKFIESPEKHIAKKPVVSEQYEFWTDYSCPSCGCVFEDEDRRIPYCLACGQKLDWE